MCCSAMSSLLLVLIMEGMFLGGALSGVIYSGHLLTKTMTTDHGGYYDSTGAYNGRRWDISYIGRQWYFALFFSLLPVSLAHGCIICSVIKGIRCHGPGWLVPYMAWRIFLSCGLLICMILVGTGPWNRPEDRDFIMLLFCPMLMSIALGIWSFMTCLTLRSQWSSIPSQIGNYRKIHREMDLAAARSRAAGSSSAGNIHPFGGVGLVEESGTKRHLLPAPATPPGAATPSLIQSNAATLNRHYSANNNGQWGNHPPFMSNNNGGSSPIYGCGGGHQHYRDRREIISNGGTIYRHHTATAAAASNSNNNNNSSQQASAAAAATIYSVPHGPAYPSSAAFGRGGGGGCIRPIRPHQTVSSISNYSYNSTAIAAAASVSSHQHRPNGVSSRANGVTHGVGNSNNNTDRPRVPLPYMYWYYPNNY